MESSNMKKIKAGIIGLRHLHPTSYMAHFNAMEEVDVVAVAESHTPLCESFAQQHRLKPYGSWKDMLDHEEMDLVAIFLPHVDCPEAAIYAAEKGVHLLIEKPMTADSTSAMKIVQKASEKNIGLTTPYVWRYHPVVGDIRRLIADGILGRIIGCEGRCAAGRLERYIEGGSEWMLDATKSGGGPMYNLGVHWIDLFSYMLDDHVRNALGKNVKVNDEYNIEDNSFAILTFESGVTLNLDISYTVPDSFPHGRDLYIGIRGTKGVISWAPAYEGEKDELFICSDHPSFAGAPRQTRTYEIQLTAGYSGIMGLDYLRDVADAVIGNVKMPITGEEGAYVLRVVEAVYASAESKTIVNVKK